MYIYIGINHNSRSPDDNEEHENANLSFTSFFYSSYDLWINGTMEFDFKKLA